MPKISDLALDVDRATEGVWATYPWDDRVRVKLSRITHPDYAERLEQVCAPHRDPDGNVPKEMYERLSRQAMAVLFREWEGILDDDEEPLPCTRENAEPFMVEERLRPFGNWVRNVVMGVAAYTQASAKAAAGNSSAS